MLNKKAQVEDWLPTMVMIVILVFLFIILFLPKTSQEEKIGKRVEFQSIDIDSEQFLLNFLRLPIKINGNENMIIADAINYYFISLDKNLLDQINKAAEDYLSKTDIQSDISSWSLEFKHPTKPRIIIDSKKVKTRIGESGLVDRKVAVSTIFIPGFKSDELIEIKLFYVLVGLR